MIFDNSLHLANNILASNSMTVSDSNTEDGAFRFFCLSAVVSRLFPVSLKRLSYSSVPFITAVVSCD